jgi:protein involved in polysaccharide export with SLBB domain
MKPFPLFPYLNSGALWRGLFMGCSVLLASTLFAAPDLPEKPTSSDYRVVANDQIRIRIAGETDDSASPLIQRVSSEGEISVPLLGAVKVAGLTLREAERLMEKRYRDEGFFINPQVILGFETYAPRNVSVLGQVNNPNQLDFPIEHSSMGIVSAITRAGGFTRVARTDAVKVMRTVDGKEVSYTVNVAAYLNETDKQQQFQLQPDDIVFVPERVF